MRSNLELMPHENAAPRSASGVVPLSGRSASWRSEEGFNIRGQYNGTTDTATK